MAVDAAACPILAWARRRQANGTGEVGGALMSAATIIREHESRTSACCDNVDYCAGDCGRYARAGDLCWECLRAEREHQRVVAAREARRRAHRGVMA